MCYKARLVAQGFSQRLGIDYVETYSPVMNVIIFRYFISLVVFEKLDMQLMDVVTVYLYESSRMTYIDWFKYFQTPKHALNSVKAFTLQFKATQKNVV